MDESMMTLRRLLAVHDEAIIEAGTAWVREAAAVDLAERPLAETRALVAESVRAYAALLLDGDPRPRDAFIERVTTLRSTQRFQISTLLRGFFAFHRAMGPVLARHSVPHHLAFAILRRVDAACSEAAFLTADTYARKLHAVVDDAQRELVRREKLAALGGLVAGVAHEVGTPLGVAVTAVSLAQDCLQELSDAFAAGALRQRDLVGGLGRAREAADIGLGNLQRAAGLVAGFKQLAVDQSSESRRAVALGAHVHELLASLAPLYRRGPHRVEVDVRADLVVTTYPGAIAQIVTNLLHNALVHAFPSGHVGTVILWIDRSADGQVELGCGDDGVGISPELLRRVYEPFFTTARGSGGSGLGLHIVHNLVTDLLCGTIRAESTPGRGARFTVRFPAHAEA
ncbi:HAMP domain-containing sensor histidine kinase [Nannocystis sp. ILAH1]|uniref:sensor histidine kinase n=1 Tax=unclassified Nannocystis TaxID=2627009 RepID=UPI0022706983|nr:MULTISPECIES: HAMP domain-containing sensor histidine kinase [unclassified Nannocystis]MCY0991808.1 HAMP domain-containing sensor histidine kinase [Nannocystis sp. ILAH1]MCY1067352.1 HAMP domain-containing sensor histidine kinase [Nannocystis sp. RBIL2]